MIITKRHVSRRTLLRGLGAAIALPLLDSMKPAFADTTAEAAKQPCRLGFAYVPNGIIMQEWTPAAEGSAFDLPRILEPLAPYQDQIMILSGLTHHNGFPLGDGPGDHARAAATFLTGVHPKRTGGADIQVGISVDQLVAQNLKSATRFTSLELGCEDNRLAGNCDAGYSCAYSNTIAWRTPTEPLPAETNPRALFERLFGAESGNPAEKQKRRQYETSILDFVLEDAARLNTRLGPGDRRKIDEYLAAVREIETRIQVSEQRGEVALPSMEKPDGIPPDFRDYAKLMFDLMLVAFQTGMTRVGTFMLGHEGSTRTYREIGVPDAHHPLTHHRNNPEWIEKVVQINRCHLEQFAYLVGKMKSTPDGDGTLLDHTILVYGSGLSDGNRHDHADLPVLVAGGGNGTLTSGRHIRYPKETPMTNLYTSIMDRMGIPTESFGD